MSSPWVTVPHGPIGDLKATLWGAVRSLIRIVVFVRRHRPAGTTQGSSVSVVENLVICKPAAHDRTLPFPSNLQVGTFNLIIARNAMRWRQSPGTGTSPAPVYMHFIRPPRHLHASHRLLIHRTIRSYLFNYIRIISCTETCASPVDRDRVESQEVSSQDVEEEYSLARTDLAQDQSQTVTRPVGRSVDWSVAVDDQRADEDVMQISGAGHWFLEGWIGDHAVDFLVDSGSAVTAVSCSFYKALVEAGALVVDLRPTARKLRGDNGSHIDILGCSSCVVSFLGLLTEFPILVCDLSTDAIIGTDTLGFILPHTLDIKQGLLFTEGGVSLQLHRRGRSIIWTHLHCGTLFNSAVFSGLLEGLTVFSENTGLVVGRTLVDPSGWKVPVSVSNFGQETVIQRLA